MIRELMCKRNMLHYEHISIAIVMSSYATSIQLHCTLTLLIIILLLSLLSESRRVKRVVGGTEVDCGSQVQIVMLKETKSHHHLCGAVLLTRNVAVTAAHCVQASYQYTLQFSNLCGNNSSTQTRVLEVIGHPEYDRYTSAHDIALLRIDGAYNITWPEDSLLPNTSFGLSGECIIYGYGYIDVVTQTYSNRLRAATVNIISLDECTNILGPFLAPSFDSGMLCAVGNGVDACQGDSGGPMMCGGKLQGITSYGLSCALPNIPGVYTSIGTHLQWISESLKQMGK